MMDPGWVKTRVHSGDLKSGALIELQQCGEKRVFFLGPAIFKPRLQVLVEGEVRAGNRNRVHICRKDTDDMVWLTSQQLFQSILEGSDKMSTMCLKTYDYTLPVEGPLLFAEVIQDSVVSHTLHSSPPKKEKKRASSKLPFGLTLQRPRKRRNIAATRHVKGKNSDGGQPKSKDEPLAESLLRELGHGDFRLRESETDSQDDPGSDSTSSADTEGEERTAHRDQRQEEDATRQVLDSHMQLVTQEQAKAAEPMAAEPMAAEPSQASNPAVFAHARPPTRCNSHLGIVNISVQTHGRLPICRHCSQKIAKKQGRIGYSFSLQKFHCYVHLACFSAYLDSQKGDASQACSFIDSWLQANPGVIPEVREELRLLAAGLR